MVGVNGSNLWDPNQVIFDWENTIQLSSNTQWDDIKKTWAIVRNEKRKDAQAEPVVQLTIYLVLIPVNESNCVETWKRWVMLSLLYPSEQIIIIL